MSAAKEVYCGPSRGSKGGDSGLGMFWLMAVLAGEPLLVLSTHSGEEGVLLDFFSDFLAFFDFFGGDSEGSRLFFLFGRGDSLLRLCHLLGEGDLLSWSDGEPYP